MFRNEKNVAVVDIRQCSVSNVIKPKVVKEALLSRSKRNPSAKLRQSNRPDKRIELTMQLQYFALVERRFCSKHSLVDLEKTANMN